MIHDSTLDLFQLSKRGPNVPLDKPQSDHRIAKMLYLVGLGLADETDITVKGLEVVKRADRVYLEAYTSILLVQKEKLVCRVQHFAHVWY